MCVCVCAWVGVRAYCCCCYCQHYKLITNWAEFKSALIPQAAVEQRIDKGFKIDCSFRCWHNCFCCVKTPSRIPMHTHTRTHTCSTENVAHAYTHTWTCAMFAYSPIPKFILLRFTGLAKCTPSISCSRSVADMASRVDLVPCWWAHLTAWWIQSRHPIEYYIRHRPQRFLTVGRPPLHMSSYHYASCCLCTYYMIDMGAYTAKGREHGGAESLSHSIQP